MSERSHPDDSEHDRDPEEEAEEQSGAGDYGAGFDDPERAGEEEEEDADWS